MRNNFDPEARLIFSDDPVCWYCEKNHIDCLHHIVGRGPKSSNLESSIYNAAPLNNEQCHLPIHGMLMKDFSKMRLLVRTKKFLEGIGHEKSTKDIQFIEKYKKLYGR